MNRTESGGLTGKSLLLPIHETSFDDHAEQVAEHRAYLNRMEMIGAVGKDVAEAARAVFESSQKLASVFPIPAASALDGTMHYSWFEGVHRLTIDMEACGACDWFYTQAGTSLCEGEDFLPREDLPLQLKSRLSRLVSVTSDEKTNADRR